MDARKLERWCPWCAAMVTPCRSRKRWPPWEHAVESCCPACGKAIGVGATGGESAERSGDRAPSAPAGNPAPASSWTVAPVQQVARWRRTDRERLDRARAALAPEQREHRSPDSAATLARELRRLADMHAQGLLSNEEFVAAVVEAIPKPAG